MKTPSAEPQARKSGYDISTWLTVAFAVLALLKLGIVISRHV